MDEDHVPSRGPAEAVYRSLLTQVLDGSLIPGSQLPTEHALADQYGVGRSTLRRALDRLRIDRLISTRRGDGNYVAGITEAEPRTLQLGADANFGETFEIRRLLDGLAASHAASTNDPSKISDIERAHAAFTAAAKAAVIDVIEVRRTDIEFHLAIANCTANSLLKELIDFFTPAVGPFWLTWMKLNAEQHRLLAEDTLKEHSLILSAIQIGDPSIAEEATRHHFQSNRVRHERLFGRQ